MIAKGVYHFRQAGNNFSTGHYGGCAGFVAKVAKLSDLNNSLLNL